MTRIQWHRIVKIFAAGPVVFLYLFFPFIIGARPVLWLGWARFTHLFEIGLVASCAVIVACSVEFGSYTAFLDQFLAPKTQRPVGACIMVAITCLSWSLSLFFATHFAVRMTARADAEISARTTHTFRTKSCRDGAVFTAASGEVDVCLVGRGDMQARVPAPADLQLGEVVILTGKRDAIGFVVHAIRRAAAAPDAP